MLAVVTSPWSRNRCPAKVAHSRAHANRGLDNLHCCLIMPASCAALQRHTHAPQCNVMQSLRLCLASCCTAGCRHATCVLGRQWLLPCLDCTGYPGRHRHVRHIAPRVGQPFSFPAAAVSLHCGLYRHRYIAVTITGTLQQASQVHCSNHHRYVAVAITGILQ